MDISSHDKAILDRMCLLVSKEDYKKFWDIYMADEVHGEEGFLLDIIEALIWRIYDLEEDKFLLKELVENA